MLNQFIIFAFVMVIFYLLVIRPQKKKHSEHQRLLQNLKAGDKVITSSGVHGLIANVKEKTITLKVSDNVKIEFERSSIAALEEQKSQHSSKSL